jgi:autotransporter passenger strand-loop-strand repeat protein
MTTTSVTSGATSTSLTLSNGDFLYVSSAGTATFTTVRNGGTEVVLSGATTSVTTVSDGGVEIMSGGTASFTTVSRGGEEIVSSRGTARFTTVNGGGTEAVFIYGTATDTTVNNGGTMDVSNGSAIDTMVDAGGAEFLYSGSASDTTLDGGTLSVTGGAQVNDTTVNSGGVLTANFVTISAITSFGVVETHVNSTVVNAGGFLIVSGNVAGAAFTLTTLNSGGTEILTVADVPATVTMSVGASIDLAYLPYAAGGSAWFVSSVTLIQDGVLYVSVGGETTSQSLKGTYADTHFQLVSATSGGTLVTLEQDVPCYRSGTRILMGRGEVAVEALRVGDVVRTVMSETAAPIIWLGRRDIDCARHPHPQTVWPIRVAPGAFGPGRPHTDLFLSPDHAVYLNNVLIPIRHLINATTITQIPTDRVTYYHLELPHHDVLLAHGLPAESFLDLRDGSNYANRPGPTRLYLDHAAQMWEAFGCAPLIVTGPKLAAARKLLESHAAATPRTAPPTPRAA